MYKQIKILILFFVISLFILTGDSGASEYSQGVMGVLSGNISPSTAKTIIYVKQGGYPTYPSLELRVISKVISNEGNYEVSLPEGIYDIIISADGYYIDTSLNGILIKPNLTAIIKKIELTPIVNSGSLSGSVKPSGADIIVVVKRDGFAKIEGISSSNNGKFEIKNLEPGLYQLVVPESSTNGKYHRFDWLDIPVQENKTTGNINFTITPLASDIISDQVIVEFSKNIPEIERLEIINSSGSTVMYRTEGLGFITYFLNIPDDKAVLDIIDHFKNNKSVSNSRPYRYSRTQTSEQLFVGKENISNVITYLVQNIPPPDNDENTSTIPVKLFPYLGLGGVVIFGLFFYFIIPYYTSGFSPRMNVEF